MDLLRLMSFIDWLQLQGHPSQLTQPRRGFRIWQQSLPPYPPHPRPILEQVMLELISNSSLLSFHLNSNILQLRQKPCVQETLKQNITKYVSYFAHIFFVSTGKATRQWWWQADQWKSSRSNRQWERGEGTPAKSYFHKEETLVGTTVS